MDSIGSEREQGPSWARANWPVAELDDLNAGLDPTLMTIETVAGSSSARNVVTMGAVAIVSNATHPTR